MSIKQGTVTRTTPAANQPGSAYLGKMGGGVYALGSSDDGLAQLAYDTSPILKGTYGDDEIKELFQAELTGLRSFNPDFQTPDGVSGVNMDYSSAPNLADVSVGDHGRPATSFGPTVASPSDLTDNASSLPKVISPAAMANHGTLGSTLSPAESSRVISDQVTAMVKGKSKYTVSIEATTPESS